MNIEQLRSDTPGTDNVIHFNNAGASLMPQQVVTAINSYLKQELHHGGYETARHYHSDLENIYEHIAGFINGETEEIALLENATEAWNMAFYSIDFEDGDRILTSVSEYASNFINYLHLKKRIKATIDVIPNDQYGQTSVESLEKMMDERVKLVSITHIPTNNGLVNPIEKIGAITQNYDCFFLVDACQSVGQYPIDVQQIKCDMLSATGRKYLRGPRGTGFLYISQEKIQRLIPPFLDLHSAAWIDENHYKIREDSRRFENWESNKAAQIGLGAAIRYAADIGIDNIWKRVTYLADYLRNLLSEIPKVTVQDIGQTQCGIVTFTVDSLQPKVVQKKLSDKNINVNTSNKSSTLIDMQKRNLEELVRASIHYYNTEKEIEQMATALRSII
ncbi:MAG TPA: aminotransferase class V-fold PLP-dependent enzyme [Balneolaceae bacterium]|nr:aminotransferase class V-fold PLP-dependent enzyme [Balneolaceae bacterium]